MRVPRCVAEPREAAAPPRAGTAFKALPRFNIALLLLVMTEEANKTWAELHVLCVINWKRF